MAAIHRVVQSTAKNLGSPSASGQIGRLDDAGSLLCTGNYFRSRFAQEWFNAQAERRGLGQRPSQTIAIKRP